MRTFHLAVAVCTFVFIVPAAFAGIPGVPEVPQALPKADQATLIAEQSKLARDRQALIREGRAINHDCARVEKESAAYRDCLERQGNFMSHLAALRTSVNALSVDIASAVSTERERLTARDQALDLAINSDLTAIRRLGFDQRAEDFAEWQKLGEDARRSFVRQLKEQVENVVVSTAQEKVPDIFKGISDSRLQRAISALEHSNYPGREKMLKALREVLANRARIAEQAGIIETGIERGLQGAAAENREERLQFLADFVCDAAETTKVLKGCHLLESELQVVSASIYNNFARRVALSQVNHLTELTDEDLKSLKTLNGLLKKHMEQRNRVRATLNSLK